MSNPDSDRPPELDALARGARREGARDLRWRTEKTPPVARHLGQIGVLGFMIVIPMLIGIYAGRWLDTQLHTGLFFTAPLLMLGAVAGCWWAWRWIQKT
jgi:ATP synthase protein I